MDAQRAQRVAQLLATNVREEIAALDAHIGFGLDESRIQQLADAIAANVLYAFSVDWSPDWVMPGEVHTWESAGSWFARCSVCLSDSAPETDRATAIGWARGHAATAHY